MPSVTLTFSAADAARLRAALAGTPYPQTVVGLKALLADYLASRVTEYERTKAREAALAIVDTTPMTPAPIIS